MSYLKLLLESHLSPIMEASIVTPKAKRKPKPAPTVEEPLPPPPVVEPIKLDFSSRMALEKDLYFDIRSSSQRLSRTFMERFLSGEELTKLNEHSKAIKAIIDSKPIR